MTIMPALFVFALTSELKLSHRMHEVAEETEHAIKSVEWAEKQHLPVAARSSSSSSSNKTYSSLTEEEKMKQREELRILYRQSVLNSGVRLVETPELQPYHQAANYIQTNPFKVIAAIGVPSVALIFHGRNNKEHLNFQLKILHTRVFGQFAVICTLLGVMGLKEMMDQRYVNRFFALMSSPSRKPNYLSHVGGAWFLLITMFCPVLLLLLLPIAYPPS